MIEVTVTLGDDEINPLFEMLNLDYAEWLISKWRGNNNWVAPLYDGYDHDEQDFDCISGICACFEEEEYCCDGYSKYGVHDHLPIEDEYCCSSCMIGVTCKYDDYDYEDWSEYQEWVDMGYTDYDEPNFDRPSKGAVLAYFAM